jgi:hypothetical protein
MSRCIAAIQFEKSVEYAGDGVFFKRDDGQKEHVVFGNNIEGELVQDCPVVKTVDFNDDTFDPVDNFVKKVKGENRIIFLLTTNEMKEVLERLDRPELNLSFPKILNSDADAALKALAKDTESPWIVHKNNSPL